MAIASKLYVILAVGMCRLRNGRVDGGFVVRHTCWTKEQTRDWQCLLEHFFASRQQIFSSLLM
jgi:hypothetical protein